MISDILLKPLRKLLSPALVESLKINWKNFRDTPPIVIYQMGKVGSTTVCESLKNADLPNPVYHVHFLSHDGIKNAEEYFLGLQKGISPPHIKRSKMLRKKIDKKKGVQWKIITLVREPIGREISDFFQVVDRYYPDLIDENGDVNKSSAIEFLQERLANYDESTNYTSTWFDKELKQAFNIDVYAYPFNHEDSFTIIRKENINVLILRLEDLHSSFNNALSQFLDLEAPVRMVTSNVGRDKSYSEAYRYVLKNIAVPESVCAKIYSSKYTKHFYDENSINEFIHKWSKV